MSTGLWTGSTGVGSRVHGFIKRRSLATDPTVEVAGSGRGRRGLALAAARHDRAQRLTGVRIFSSYGSRFSMIFAPTGSQQRGNLIMLTLIGREQRRSPATMRRLGQSLATVRVASGETSAPRACANASSSSLLASRPTNCSERWRKTWIWWLPRVRSVLDLRPKIRTIGSARYRGFSIGS
jgi:hypothetical protein